MECAMVLGVTLESLWFLGAAFAPEYNAFAFPMSDGDGNVCGIRLRTSAGRKLAVKGSRAGAFFPTGALNKVESQRVWICEGVTDTAAALSVGFFAMGRPSCVGQEDILLALLGQIAPREAVIVADNDERETPQGTRRPGMAGAAKLSDMLPLRHLILTPPSKDFRAMCLAGAGRQVIEAMLSNLLWNQGKKDSFNP
jgi:hypothetical protein